MQLFAYVRRAIIGAGVGVMDVCKDAEVEKCNCNVQMCRGLDVQMCNVVQRKNR